MGSKSNDVVLAAEGAFAVQNGRLQSKLIGVQQQLMKQQRLLLSISREF